MKKFLILLVFLGISGCGYTTGGFVGQTNQIVIEPVINKINITSESRKYSDYTTFPVLIENKLTNEIVNKFNIDGNLKVTNEDIQALKLTCVVADYRKETLRYEEDDDVKEQRLRLHVNIKLADSKGKILKDRQVVGETTYMVSGSEAAAQVDLVDDTARRVVEAVVERW